jgi:nucleolin
MANEEAKLFVAGLPDSISEDVLKQLFEATGGKVGGVSLPKDRMTGRPRGFGFVTMTTPEEAQAARDALDGSMQGGKSISVRPFQAEPPRRDGVAPGGPRTTSGPPGPRGPAGAAQSPDRTLYIGNLPYDATIEEVQTLINGVAPDSVVRVHLPMDADGRKRGFGFVTMASSEAAKSAEVALRTADLRNRRLVVNLAHPKGERPAGGGPGGGGGFGGPAPFSSSFGGGAGGGPPKKSFEQPRKRTFEDGGGAAAPGAGRKKAKERGGANKFNYPADDDE